MDSFTSKFLKPDPATAGDPTHALLKKIASRLWWIMIWCFVIALNTCHYRS
jgi:hypothetical protein